MKIINVHRYRDGGTYMIETTDGKYWIPGRMDQNHLTVFKGENYFDGTSTLVTDVKELHYLINMLALDSNFYHSIKHAMGYGN